MTINERPLPVLDAVFGTLKEQAHDQLVIVFDRSPEEIRHHVHEYWQEDARLTYVDIEGDRGWKSPVPAWNAAFAAVVHPLIYCFSGETLQAPDNIEHAKFMLEDDPNTIIFGKALCSCGPNGSEVNWGGTAPSNLLVDAAHARPLGFIWAGPTQTVRHIGGMDNGFSGGYWYDDDDFFYRLWRTGADFLFDDAISGVHLHHERPVLATAAGQAGIARNAAYITSKLGTTRPLDGIIRLVSSSPGRTRWSHP
jgi:hypothetical protein